jgi:conjugative transposon TraN protein
MKKTKTIVFAIILLVLTGARAYSQVDPKAVFATSVEPFRLAITYHKTTHLIFPYAIKSVDRGSDEILVQKARGVENILQVKAAWPNFRETNLTLITADGRLFSFALTYSERPQSLTLEFAGNPVNAKSLALFSTPGTTEAEIQQIAEKIVGKKKTVGGLKDARYGMQFQITGIYNKEDVLYFQIKVKNTSNINYGIDQLRFFIRDQKQVQRTATQELELDPVYEKGELNSIAGSSEKVFVFALPKFTIPDNKYLAVQLMEKDGGRHLEVKVPNRAILHAKPISAF